MHRPTGRKKIYNKAAGCAGLNAVVENMKGIYRDGYYGGPIELRDVFNRRCVKCGRGHFVQAKTMGIRTGIVFWNLVFSLMFTCVKGTSHCSILCIFLVRFICAYCVRGHACVKECACAGEKSKALMSQIAGVFKGRSLAGFALNAGFDLSAQ